MIQFLKEIYLTGFAIIFNHARVKQIGYKIGYSIVFVTGVEWFALLGIFGYVEMYLNKKFLLNFSKLDVFIVYFALFLINGYFLFFRGHGIKFAREFDSLKKSRRILLEVSCAVVVVVTIVFFIFSAIAHRHFIGAT